MKNNQREERQEKDRLESRLRESNRKVDNLNDSIDDKNREIRRLQSNLDDSNKKNRDLNSSLQYYRNEDKDDDTRELKVLKSSIPSGVTCGRKYKQDILIDDAKEAFRKYGNINYRCEYIQEQLDDIIGKQ